MQEDAYDLQLGRVRIRVRCSGLPRLKLGHRQPSKTHTPCISVVTEPTVHHMATMRAMWCQHRSCYSCRLATGRSAALGWRRNEDPFASADGAETSFAGDCTRAVMTMERIKARLGEQSLMSRGWSPACTLTSLPCTLLPDTSPVFVVRREEKHVLVWTGSPL